MRIYVTQGPNGQAISTSRNTKRPKFQVTLLHPARRKVSAMASLAGHAMSYTGAAVTAPRKYRVVREVRWPSWWGWYSGRRSQVQTARNRHGATTTGADGSSKSIRCTPEPKVSKGRGSFTFSVYRMSPTCRRNSFAQRGVNGGFTTLQHARAGDWQTGQTVELNIRPRPSTASRRPLKAG